MPANQHPALTPAQERLLLAIHRGEDRLMSGRLFARRYWWEGSGKNVSVVVPRALIEKGLAANEVHGHYTYYRDVMKLTPAGLAVAREIEEREKR